MTSELTVREAVRIIDAGPTNRDPLAPEVVVALATSFTPLHLETLLRARVQQLFADRGVRIEAAAYGDLANGIDAVAATAVSASAVVIEWQDLDPRLGRRESVTAALASRAEIVANTKAQLARIESSLRRAGARCRTVVSLPALPLAPPYGVAGGRVGALRADLDLLLAEFVVACEGLPGVVPVRPGQSSEPPYDARSDTGAGHPYSQRHDSQLAGVLASVMFPPPPKKGLITDLDDTLWRGLVGEVGADAVHWNLDDGSHLHAQYQQLLVALAQRGVLIAIASKNDDAVVLRALERPDLLVKPEHYFPVVATWGPKSASVAHILKAWNIGAGDVVFVDDSAAELAEVERAHPSITGLLFPTSSANQLAELLDELNELFWTEATTAEDSLRLESIRKANLVDEARHDAATPSEFIASLDGSLTLDLGAAWAEGRALELVNKTNQFNLNGRRFTRSDWHELCTRPQAVNITASYADRFGQLGIISVVTGQVRDQTLHLDTWVLSCRAFSRGIERRLLAWLLQEFGVVEFDFTPTERNAPIADFLSSSGANVVEARPRVSNNGAAGELTRDLAPQLIIERGDSD